VAVSADRPAPHRSAADVPSAPKTIPVAMVWSLANYLNFFQRTGLLEHVRSDRRLRNVLVTGITFAVSLPVAFYITKVISPRYSGFLSLLLLMPFLGQRTGTGLRVDDPAAGKRCHQPFSR
jgi:ABC-type spermidine/putrescine transport system permease subunit I